MISQRKLIPVILDTDIGDDIDDTWALAMLLRSPELNLRLVTTATGDTTYRARLVAKLLALAGRSDVPIGIGIGQPVSEKRGRQADWVEGYDLASYGGEVHADGVTALIDTIMGAADPVTLICIGPVTNIAEALRRKPEIAGRANFVGMLGCFHVCHDGRREKKAEWNIRCDVQAAQKVLSAPWRTARITPLDTCGQVRLRGRKYKAVAECDDPLAQCVIENYRIWLRGEVDEMSSILFDTVAVYMAFSTDLLEMRRMKVRVDDTAMTIEDPTASSMDCAMTWKDLDAFEDLLVERLTTV
ncbi:MAG: nucleoside hydrolase [Planctomycetes bacterium]|nr:nucleoside hydrolase [Planctomycetota bacterium]